MYYYVLNEMMKFAENQNKLKDISLLKNDEVCEEQ